MFQETCEELGREGGKEKGTLIEALIRTSFDELLDWLVVERGLRGRVLCQPQQTGAQLHTG